LATEAARSASAAEMTEKARLPWISPSDMDLALSEGQGVRAVISVLSVHKFSGGKESEARIFIERTMPRNMYRAMILQP